MSVGRRPLLAAEYLYCAHDTISGRLLLSDRAVGVGLGGARLGELVLASMLRITQGHLQVTSTRSMGLVGDRMVTAGLVEHRRTRRLWRRVDRFVPKDLNAAEWPTARLATIMREQEPMEHADAALAGIIAATGLAPRLFAELDVEPLRYATGELRRQRDVAGESLSELVTQIEAALGDAVLTYQT